MQYAHLTRSGPLPIATYVLRTLSRWFHIDSFDLTTPLIYDIRMAFRARRVSHKVLAVKAFREGAEAAPGTTAHAAAMGRLYGNLHQMDGRLPFVSTDVCMFATEYDTNKKLHHFARGFNESTGRPPPEWGNEGDMNWRMRVCDLLSTRR